MDNESIDVNTDAASSTESNVDVSTASSSGKTETEQTQNEAPTLHDLVGTALEAASQDATKESSTEAETEKEQGEEGAVQDLNKTEEALKEKGGDETEDVSAEDRDQEKGPVPYDRFHEVVEQKNALEGRVKEYEPIVENYRSIETYCQENAIEPDQFQEALRIVAAINSDPRKALEMLQPTIDALQGLAGNKLPSDLAQEVEEGLITEERAKEIAQLRAHSQMSQKRAQVTEEQRQRAANQERVNGMRNTLETWDVSRQKTDPDFRPKKSAEAADGKYEWFLDKMSRLLATNPPKTAQQAIQLAEQAYAQVNNGAARFTPKKPAMKALTSTRSSTVSNTKEPESVGDIVKRRLSQEPRG